MALHRAILLGGLATVVAASGFNFNSALSCDASDPSSPATACSILQHSFPNITYFNNETMYTEDNEAYWSSSSWLYPACIFAPTDADQMSFGVKVLTSTCTPFALKGGGHMPISNAANINSSGVLIAASGLTNVQLSESGDTVFVGPGNRWEAVYEYLQPYGLVVVGGRLGIVGVPGYLLGGGIAFFSNQYGWASSSIVSIECVLASGQIVNASATNEYSDLFWAMRGGGNSFCLATNFELKTYYKPQMYVGNTVYSDNISEPFLDHVYDFAVNGSQDNKAAITPLVNWYSYAPSTLSFIAMRFYDGNDSAPAAFTNFTAPVMTPTSDTWRYRTFYNWSVEYDSKFAEAAGLRQSFTVVSFPASREALGIVHSILFSEIQTLANASGTVIAGMAYMPITANYIEAGVRLSGQDAMGVDPTQAPYIWVEESMTWTSAADDDAVAAYIATANAKIAAAFAAADIPSSPYLYLNDAADYQPVFQGYPDCNVQALKRIRAKYDPARILTDLMPGGWKVAGVEAGVNTTIGCASGV